MSKPDWDVTEHIIQELQDMMPGLQIQRTDYGYTVLAYYPPTNRMAYLRRVWREGRDGEAGEYVAQPDEVGVIARVLEGIDAV